MSKKQITIAYWFLGLFMLILSGLSLTNQIQQVITFRDPLNEMFFFMLTALGGIIFMLGAFIDDTELK
jgi:hypothetical protein